MTLLAGVLGLALILTILWDVFETVVMPQRVARRLRLARRLIRFLWGLLAAGARRLPSSHQREARLSFAGPLILLVTLATWALGLILGFALLHWSLGSSLMTPDRATGFGADLYFSGTTFFTLGLGDVQPLSRVARALTVAEAGIGFGFLALVIGYVPVFYQAYSRRETNISTLDERAGSPPTAAELLRRLGPDDGVPLVAEFLGEWERWAAELMETHLSYPILSYYRSQHDNQSWVAALTVVLDVCALVLVGVAGVPVRPARLTFAMARHCAVDLSQILGTPPEPPSADRLPPAELARLRSALRDAGIPLGEGPAAESQLADLRAEYEPYVAALSRHLVMPLPPFVPPADAEDNWQTTAWGS